MKPQCILHLGWNNYRDDFVDEFQIPILWQYIKSSNDEKIFVGCSPHIGGALREHKQFSAATLSINDMCIIFFTLKNDEWIID